MDMDKNEIMFGKHSMSTLMQEIYANVKNRDSQINTLMEKLSGLISSGTSASILVPMMREYLDASIANNDQLVKLSSIIQKMMAAESKNVETTDHAFLTPAERTQLLADLQTIAVNTTSKKLPEAVVLKIADKNKTA